MRYIYNIFRTNEVITTSSALYSARIPFVASVDISEMAELETGSYTSDRRVEDQQEVGASPDTGISSFERVIT